jgi:hypothetical protein
MVQRHSDGQSGQGDPTKRSAVAVRLRAIKESVWGREGDTNHLENPGYHRQGRISRTRPLKRSARRHQVVVTAFLEKVRKLWHSGFSVMDQLSRRGLLTMAAAPRCGAKEKTSPSAC